MSSLMLFFPICLSVQKCEKFKQAHQHLVNTIGTHSSNEMLPIHIFSIIFGDYFCNRHLDGSSVDLTLGSVTTQAKTILQKRPQCDQAPLPWENGSLRSQWIRKLKLSLSGSHNISLNGAIKVVLKKMLASCKYSLHAWHISGQSTASP